MNANSYLITVAYSDETRVIIIQYNNTINYYFITFIITKSNRINITFSLFSQLRVYILNVEKIINIKSILVDFFGD